MISNNPPDVILELTSDQAQFLLDNCNSNIYFGLAALQQYKGNINEDIVRKQQQLIESFREIKGLLQAQGVKETTNDEF